MFWKEETRIIAKFHRIDLVLCNHSSEGKTPSYSRIYMVGSQKKLFSLGFNGRKTEIYTHTPKYWITSPVAVKILTFEFVCVTVWCHYGSFWCTLFIWLHQVCSLLESPKICKSVLCYSSARCVFLFQNNPKILDLSSFRLIYIFGLKWILKFGVSFPKLKGKSIIF